jgi:hypothetical protein
MKTITKHFDAGSWVVIVTTLILFAVALFLMGLCHDLLLKAGVLLVSVKLILMAYKNGVSTDRLQSKLDEIHAPLECLKL